jgi:hypothetical protein
VSYASEGKANPRGAIALDEGEMATLEAYGRPTYLIVPSDKHRLDAKIWKIRWARCSSTPPPASGSYCKPPTYKQIRIRRTSSQEPLLACLCQTKAAPRKGDIS